MTRQGILAGVLAAALFSTQVLAASADACLQHNRFVSWKAIDDSTLEMSDTFMKRYTVRLAGRCFGITVADAKLVFFTWTNLSCLARGDVFTVTAPGRGATTCSIAGVQAA